MFVFNLTELIDGQIKNQFMETIVSI